MLAYLRGSLQSRELTGSPAERIVVDVGGVAFEILVSRHTISQLGDVGSNVLIHTALSIRETEWTIFGFSSQSEKEMFGLLQSVTGVGPKMALSLVGTLGADKVADAISCDDQKLLSQAQGVGPKVAQRIILELKSKIENWQAKRGVLTLSQPAGSSVRDEARDILEGLGFTLTEISLAFKRADEAKVDEEVETLVRHSLKVLGSTDR